MLVLALAGIAGLGFWFWNSNQKIRSAEASRDATVQSTLHLETFVLNLADTDQKSYLRVGIDLGLSREIQRDENPPIAQVRDTILAVLSEARADDLMTAAGKSKLKQDLLQALRERAPQLDVQEVYFTEFLIQR
jgi:flagellar basal body-associated protein FliL